MKTIVVNTLKTYEIHIASGILSLSGDLVKKVHKGSACAVVTDDIVDSLYSETLTTSLQKAGYRVAKYVLKNGEASKTAENYIALLNFLAEERFTRTDAIVALGGGVVGDLAGFAASTFMRGIGFIQIPTTLLAAVDSSVGGKTAIDLGAGKNLAGTFYQPDLVLCDYSLMDSLSEDVFLDGMAEVIKYGVIADSELFEMLKLPAKPQLEEIITRCVTIKRDVVTIDEKETGPRKLLNFGHTIGHAVELCSDYSISHGKGVAIGMAVMTRACYKLGICSFQTCQGVLRLLEACLLPVTTQLSAKTLAKAALSDKKRSGGSITLVVPETIGHCVLRDVATEELEYIIGLGLGPDGE